MNRYSNERALLTDFYACTSGLTTIPGIAQGFSYQQSFFFFVTAIFFSLLTDEIDLVMVAPCTSCLFGLHQCLCTKH
jgi:hypothetical protein